MLTALISEIISKQEIEKLDIIKDESIALCYFYCDMLKNVMYIQYNLDVKPVDLTPAKNAIRVLNKLCVNYKIKPIFGIPLNKAKTKDIFEFARQIAEDPLFAKTA